MNRTVVTFCLSASNLVKGKSERSLCCELGTGFYRLSSRECRDAFNTPTAEISIDISQDAKMAEGGAKLVG